MTGKKRLNSVLSTATGILLAMVMLTPSCSQEAALPATPSAVSAPTPEQRADDWLKALKGNNLRATLDAAVALLASAPSVTPSPAYKGFTEHEGLEPGFLAASLNTWDYQIWHDALVLRGIAKELTATDVADPVATITEAVARRTQSLEKSDQPYIHTPGRIWERQWGLCDRQAWLAAELLYQLGYETQIIYLRRDGTSDSPHTIAEVRRADDVWTIDPLNDICLPGIAAADLADDPALMQRIWPERPDWHDALQHAIMYTPSMAQDYCARNQRLCEAVAEVLGDERPRFGQDPINRQQAYIALRNRGDEQQRQFPMMLWHFPIRMLALEIHLARQAQLPEN